MNIFSAWLHHIYMRVWGLNLKGIWTSKPRGIQYASQGIGNVAFVIKMKYQAIKLPLF